MRKRNMIISIVLTVVSIIYTILVKVVDVKPIGVSSSEIPHADDVGFSTMNQAFSKLVGSNMIIYKITEILGILLLFLVLVYGCIGVYQLIKRKSLFKVDREIVILGCLYVLMMAVYIFFEKVIINYRPVLIDEVLEASYPSSHTILALCVGLSSLKISKKYFNKNYIKLISKITLGLTLLVLIGRTISGVHWISDIIGGLLISFTLLSYFNLAYDWNKVE